MIAAYIVFFVAVALAVSYLGLVHLWLGKESSDPTPSPAKTAPAPAPRREARTPQLRPSHA